MLHTEMNSYLVPVEENFQLTIVSVNWQTVTRIAKKIVFYFKRYSKWMLLAEFKVKCHTHVFLNVLLKYMYSIVFETL